MKCFMVMVLGMIMSAPSFASHRIIGLTEAGCPLQVTVVQEVSGKLDRVLLVAQRDVRTLKLDHVEGRVKVYRSLKADQFYATYEVTLMAPEMSRLSELRVYLSGRMFSCLIDV